MARECRPVAANGLSMNPVRLFDGSADSAGQSRSWIMQAAFAIVLLAAFVALEWISSLHEFMSVPITAWNPGLGVVFAFMLLLGPAYAAVLFAGVLCTEFFVLGTSLEWPIILTIAASIAFVYGLAAGATRRILHIDAGLYHVRDLFVLLAVGLLAGVASSALVALALLIDHRIALDNVLLAATPLLIGDIIGITVMTPLTLRLAMLVQGRASLSGYSRPLVAEIAFYVAFVGGSLWIIVGSPISAGLKYFYLLFVPVVLAAVRHGFDGAIVALAATQFALVGLMRYFGYDAQAFTEMQSLMLVLTATGLVVGAVVSERTNDARLVQRAEERLRELEAEANQAARFSLVGGMASALAHEINQPMTAARALARSVQHLLDQPTPDLARARGNVANAIAQIDHASGVMRRMRDFLRRGQPHYSSFDIREMLEDALTLARPDAVSRNIALSVAVEADLPLALGDRVQLQQVVLNLVRNAAEAIVMSGAAGGEIAVSAVRRASCFEIAVRDSGPGLTDEVVQRLFEPLTTSKREGLGLGLSIARSIVESHGGRLWLHSGERGGTEFRFTLPRESVSDATTDTGIAADRT